MQITTITLDVADVPAAQQLHKALGIDDRIGLRSSEAPTSGFRGFHLSLIVPQPADVDRLLRAALGAGAEQLKPAKKSLWGYGGVVQAPDGTIWKVVSESKKDTSPATGEITDIVLLLGVTDVRASKQFYLDRGLVVAKSFAGKYVEFDTGTGPVKLALLKRAAVAKDAGVAGQGSGSHRLAIGTDGEPFTDPDGFVWETAK